MGGTSYIPVIAIFSVAAFMAAALNFATSGQVFSVRTAEWFIAISVCFLAVQKLQDVLEFTILPGLVSSDDNLNPFLPWLQSTEGKLRLEALIRLSLWVATIKNSAIQCVETVCRMRCTTS